MKAGERLMSLDVLRGVDMVFLCVFYHLATSAAESFGFADAAKFPFMRQFYHYWGGFNVIDIVMPLFIFMCGAAIPFALSKRMSEAGRPTVRYWKHVLFRVLLLWVLGMVAQGQLLTLDPKAISPFNNTLQTIAVGYAIAAAVFCLRSRLGRAAVLLALPVVYGVALAAWGDYGRETNLAQVCEQRILSLVCPPGSQAFKTIGYTWFLTVPMFGFMALCGLQATEIIRRDFGPWRKAACLAVLGVSFLLIGWIAEGCGIPCIKHIFTVSFTFQAMGWCFLLLDFFFVLIDVLGFRRGWWLFVLYGQTSLAAYLFGDIFVDVVDYASKTFAVGMPHLVGEQAMPFVIKVVSAILLTFGLFVWWKGRLNARVGKEMR